MYLLDTSLSAKALGGVAIQPGAFALSFAITKRLAIKSQAEACNVIPGEAQY